MIRFHSVTKQFGDGTTALDDVSFVIHPGEFVFITGHSGSGKTTIMKLLTKEYNPTSGNIHFKESVINELSSSKLPHHRRQIGVVFQDYKLIPDYTVWENIALPLYITNTKESDIESRVSDLLKLVNLTDKAYQFPSQLSGGEAQRVSIARALANAPSVIFADEPTGNLDVEATMLIAQLLHKINELGTTILCATHDLSVLEHLQQHRRIQLEKGKLISDTHPKEVESFPKKETQEHYVKEESTDKKDPDHRDDDHKENEKDDKVDKVDKEDKEDDDQKEEKPKVGPRIKLGLPKLPWSKKPAEIEDEDATEEEEEEENEAIEEKEELQEEKKQSTTTIEVKIETL